MHVVKTPAGKAARPQIALAVHLLIIALVVHVRKLRRIAAVDGQAGNIDRFSFAFLPAARAKHNRNRRQKQRRNSLSSV